MPRSSVVICDKWGPMFKPGQPPSFDASREAGRKRIDATLQRLGVDYIDVWILRCAGKPEGLEDTYTLMKVCRIPCSLHKQWGWLCCVQPLQCCPTRRSCWLTVQRLDQQPKPKPPSCCQQLLTIPQLASGCPGHAGGGGVMRMCCRPGNGGGWEGQAPGRERDEPRRCAQGAQNPPCVPGGAGVVPAVPRLRGAPALHCMGTIERKGAAFHCVRTIGLVHKRRVGLKHQFRRG